MKKILMFLLIAALWVACSHPLEITHRTDPQQTTSGTMGSVRANNQMPDRPIDSPAKRIPDTLQRR